MNWGDLRGDELYKTVFEALLSSCPYSDSLRCNLNMEDLTMPWQYFQTRTAESPTDPVSVSVRIARGNFQNREKLEVMLELAALTLKAFVSQDEGFNCYEASGHVYCQVPRDVRVSSHSFYHLGCKC